MRDRFFVEGVHAAGDRVEMAAGDARKLVSVLRKRSGDRVRIVDSAGTAFAAVLDVGERAVRAQLESVVDAAAEATLQVTLAQAVPKGAKMDFVVEKAVELGVHAVVPVRTERVVAQASGGAKVDRWRRIARAAAQQSGRAHVPEVGDVIAWDALLATFARYDRVYVPWELADPAPLRTVLDRDLTDAGSVLLAIGPEGGFSADEIDAARDAGATVVSLGRRILRTETAALVVLAALRYARGEL